MQPGYRDATKLIPAVPSHAGLGGQIYGEARTLGHTLRARLGSDVDENASERRVLFGNAGWRDLASSGQHRQP